MSNLISWAVISKKLQKMNLRERNLIIQFPFLINQRYKAEL